MMAIPKVSFRRRPSLLAAGTMLIQSARQDSKGNAMSVIDQPDCGLQGNVGSINDETWITHALALTDLAATAATSPIR